MISSVVDLGCGDGYTLDELSFSHDTNIALVDISEKQLKIAENIMKKNHKSLITLAADLSEDCWVKSLRNFKSPKVILNIFVLQEMMSVNEFFQNVDQILEKDDLFLSIIVKPEFAYDLLNKRNNIIMPINRVTDFEWDWCWAAKYPITTNSHTIYLPHFHRTINDYKKIIEKHNLFINEIEFLSVPNDDESRKMFEMTDYEDNILKASSSVLLSIKKKE